MKTAPTEAAWFRRTRLIGTIARDATMAASLLIGLVAGGWATRTTYFAIVVSRNAVHDRADTPPARSALPAFCTIASYLFGAVAASTVFSMVRHPIGARIRRHLITRFGLIPPGRGVNSARR